VEVHDIRRVHGGEAALSANHVATALARWRERGEGAADLAFWRKYPSKVSARPRRSHLVVDALLRKDDYRAAMALLTNWLSQAEQVPLEDGVPLLPHARPCAGCSPWRRPRRQKAEGRRQKAATPVLPSAFCLLPF